jgi:hypothetical protein
MAQISHLKYGNMKLFISAVNIVYIVPDFIPTK